MNVCGLNGGSIMNWLNSCNAIEKVEPSKVFKKYLPLDRGNKKLCKDILSFSLLPVVTCGGACKGCYDVKSMRHTSARKKRYVNTSMAYHNLPELERLIFRQVKASKTVKFLRLHVGGEFFSKEYVEFWKQLAIKIKEIKPYIKIYTYTKHVEYIESLNEAGINVVQSIYPEGYNYGSLEYIQTLAKKYNGSICPATLGKVPEQFCGDKCKACMVKKEVFFKLH